MAWRESVELSILFSSRPAVWAESLALHNRLSILFSSRPGWSGKRKPKWPVTFNPLFIETFRLSQDALDRDVLSILFSSRRKTSEVEEVVIFTATFNPLFIETVLIRLIAAKLREMDFQSSFHRDQHFDSKAQDRAEITFNPLFIETYVDLHIFLL